MAYAVELIAAVVQPLALDLVVGVAVHFADVVCVGREKEEQHIIITIE